MKHLQRVKSVIVVLAVVLSLWATYVSVLHVGGAGRMLFVDSSLPHRSFEAFLHEIPGQVRDDVLRGHESGMRMTAIPLMLSSLLWFTSYVACELQRKRTKRGEQGGGKERR